MLFLPAFFLIPSFSLWLSTSVLQGTMYQLPVLIGSKILLLVIPFFYRKSGDIWQVSATRTQLGVGVITGITLALGLFAVYLIFSSYLDMEHFRKGVEKLGVNSVQTYVAMAVFWSFINAFTEEVFWRWFAIGQLKKYLSVVTSIIVAAIFFSLHHGIATAMYFPWWMVIGAMFATTMAGLLWGHLYTKYQTTLVPFVSHIIADLTIFTIGFALLYS